MSFESNKKRQYSLVIIAWTFELEGLGFKFQLCPIDRPEINPHTYSQLIFNKGGKNIQWRKDKSLQQVVLR